MVSDWHLVLFKGSSPKALTYRDEHALLAHDP